MECRQARAAQAAPGDIPAGYLHNVALRAYYLEINLAVERWSFSGRVRIPVEVRAGPARRIFYLHAAARLQLTSAKVGGVPGVLFRDRATRIEVPEEAAVPGGTSTVIEVCFAGEISKWRTDGLYMGAGKPGLPRRGSGAREEGAQGGAEGEGPGRGDEGERPADTFGNEEEAAAATAAAAAAAKTPRDTNRDESDGGPALAFAPGAVLATHLEPTHARELFPCVDLPRAKAVFQLTLRGIPAHLQAISNTPALRTEIEDVAALPAASDGSRPVPLKSVCFQETPVMPTYIFGFWVGDFCSVSTRALATTAVCGSDSPSQPPRQPSLQQQQQPSPQQPRPSTACSGGGDTIQINVHVVRGVDLEGAKFALDFARRAFELFARLFSVRFPMPKLDLIGLPQMHGLGMENFGAITCLQEYLLVTADTSFVRRRRIARLICHEVSHMWYGDIVTPESFDELWLKEGMARFFEYLAVESLDSSYHVWNNFMTEVFFQAMLADTQESSHPVVQQHNGDIASILDSFDTITYCKGASVLRMLSHCVGLDRFLRGMRDYVASHQYGCATQEDLWGAVQGVCDRDGVAVNVRDLMQPWLTRPRFPVLRLRMTGSDLSITQQPFSFFAVPEVGTSGGPSSTAAKADALRASRKGASEIAVARSTKLPRTGAPTAPDDGRSSVPLPAAGEPPAGAGSGAAEGAAPGCPVSAEEEGSGASRPVRSNGSDLDREGINSAGCCWVVPLRIRVGDGSRGGQEDAGPEVEGAELRRSSVSEERPGEVTHSLFLAETQTSVTLHGLSCEPAAVPPVEACAETDVADGHQRHGGEGQPYLVVNDGHSGFFTVQYECERSWGLAVAAVEQGVLNECETMGFVHDLILALHEGVLVDRRAASLSIAGLLGGGGGGDCGRPDCGVPCLFSRLREVVRLLRRDRGNPAWSTGQLFVWELLAMCASNALGEAFSLSRRQRELSLAQKRARDSPMPQKGVPGSPTLAPTQAPTGTDGVARAGAGDEGDASRRTAAECPAGAGSNKDPNPRVQSTESCSSEATEGKRHATTAVAEAEAVESRSRREEEFKAAAGRLRSVTAAMEAAVAEADAHVGWHTDRVGSGEEQAEEALQSLRAMKERLERSRAQLAWAKQHGLLRAFA